MISILANIIINETNKLGTDKKYVVNSLPEHIIIGLENFYPDGCDLPWIILDNHSSIIFTPPASFGQVLRYVEDDITAFRTYYTGKKGFLLIVPPGINYQGSLDTTMNLIEELFQKVQTEVLQRARIEEDEKVLIQKCISAYLKQSFNPTEKGGEDAWHILEMVNASLNEREEGFDSALSVLGFFHGTNKQNFELSHKLIQSLAQAIYDEGISKTFQSLKDIALRENLSEILPSLAELEQNIQLKVGDAVNFYNMPYRGISNSFEEWWQALNIKTWQILLGEEIKKDDEYSIKIISNNVLTLHSNQLLIVGGIVDFKVQPDSVVSWEVNKKKIDIESTQLKVNAEDLDVNVIHQIVTAINIEGQKKSAKFLHFDASLFPIAIDCNTASKISPFKRSKAPNEFFCEILLQSVGSHALEFYYNLEWELSQELISKDNSPDHDDNKDAVVIIAPYTKNNYRVGRAMVEIFADESCSYQMNVKGPGGEDFVLFIKATSNDGELMNVRSFYESLVVENLKKKDLSSKPRVVVPGGIFQLERLLVKHKTTSFNPIAISPDLPSLIYQVEEGFDTERNAFMSSFTLDPSFDKRPLQLHENEKFSKLISLRNQLVDTLFKQDEESIVSSFLENKNLGKILSTSEGGEELLDNYFKEFEELLNDSFAAAELTWFDTIILYWKKENSKVLDHTPSAVMLSPFHPVCLGWQARTQDMLMEAIEKKMHCPIAGLLTPSQVPSYWFLQLGKSNTIEFVSTRTNLDYWRVFWNKEKLPELGKSDVRSFLKALNIEIDNASISVSSNQVTNSLNQIKFLLSSASHYKVGVIGNDSFHGFNSGIENWIQQQFIKGEKESKGFDNIWKKIVPTSLDVYDYRETFALPQNDVLNNLVNEKNVQLNWFKIDREGKSNTFYDLGVVAKLETDNAELDYEPAIVDSILACKGILRIDYNLNHENAIMEPKKISISTKTLTSYERLILGLEELLFKKTGKNAYKYNPGLLSLTNFINHSRYSVISSSGLDLSYILNYAKGQFKLWDYELPKYGKSINAQDGYYMVSGHHKMHANVIQDSIRRLTGFLMSDEVCERLLEWMNSLGILSLKNLAAGGAISISEVGILVTHLLMQPSKIEFDGFKGLFPVSTEHSINLLIPIDPFKERIDMLKFFTDFEKNKRPDFLLLQFDAINIGRIYISPIEVKTRNGELSKKELDNAIEQAESFTEFLVKLGSYQSGDVEIWKFVFPILLSEMTRFSIGLQSSKGLLVKKEIEVVRDALELLCRDEAVIQYCKSWVICISDRNVTESYVHDNRCNIVAIKKYDILPILEHNWQSFQNRCKNGFLSNTLTCFPEDQRNASKDGESTLKEKYLSGSLEKEMTKTNRKDESSSKQNEEIDPAVNFGVERGHSKDWKWEQQYKDILSILFEHGVKLNEVADDKFVQGPAFVTYKIEPGRGVKVSSIEKLHDELKLGLRLREDQRIRFKVDGGVIKIEVPKFEEDRYFVKASTIWNKWNDNKGQLAVPIGENQEGDIVDMNFSSDNAPHLLIGGSTGSGKSEALITILQGLCTFKTSDELKLLLVDPKGTELVDFENSAHLLHDIGLYPEDAISVLEKAVQEMQDRYEVMKIKKVNKITKYNALEDVEKLPWWLIVLDEYGDLTSSPEDKKTIEFNLKRLAQKARAAGIHLIITTQKPSSEVISTNIRSNLGAQLALKVRGSAESKVILDKTGAEALNGKGDALFFDGIKLNRIQVALYKK